MSAVLERFGKAMTPRATDGSMPADIAAHLVRTRGHCRVTLQPGDATAYKLYLLWEPWQSPHVLLVVRDIGGEPSVTWVPEYPAPRDVEAISNGNPWTAEVLSWWFGLLFDEIKKL